ncbi:PhnD/SsuA/transferrin family substrate-binding protein [Parasulfuritortus cantonensis]|nr:PhnD/SsuA/transferrin family substrate-binding protein [Parasulfuritortus cantonensis]
MVKRWLPLLGAALIGVSQGAWALVMNVTLDYDQDRDHVATQSAFNELAARIGKSLGQPVRLVMTQNTERVGEEVRQGGYDILLAPAQIVGLAMRHGYVPVARTEAEARIVLVTDKSSGVRTFEQAKGHSVALPNPESLVSYMVKGELNAQGLSIGGYFGPVTYVNRYGAVLYALDIGQAEIGAVKEGPAKDWLVRHPGALVIKAYDPVPLAGVVVSGKLDEAMRDKVGRAFVGLGADMAGRLAKSGMGAFDQADSADFTKVSTRGFYTPEVLPGATIVTAEQARRLMAQGVPLYDVRPDSHYREGHIKGARHVPYEINSPKEPDYDDSVDKFNLAKLPQDKGAPMIFQCNGAECWYSYKAARYMLKRGYKQVYWFRTGLPAWKAAGYPVE